MNTFFRKIRGMRSFLSARTYRCLTTSLAVLFIAFAALAATTAVKHPPVAPAHSVGGNLMLVPGFTGIAPALY